MALVKTATLEQFGVSTEVDTYIRITHLSSIVRGETFLVSVSLQVFANEQAYLDGKQAVATDSLLVEYDKNTNVNIHTFVYNAMKVLPQYSTATDA